jgi:hypothetical protein
MTRRPCDSSGSGKGWTAGWRTAAAAASLRLNSAAPQPICMPRLRGSAYGNIRAGSACSSMTRMPGRTRNRHGWVLCSDGAATAARTSSWTSCRAHLPAPGCQRGPLLCPEEQGRWSRVPGPSDRSFTTERGAGVMAYHDPAAKCGTTWSRSGNPDSAPRLPAAIARTGQRSGPAGLQRHPASPGVWSRPSAPIAWWGRRGRGQDDRYESRARTARLTTGQARRKPGRHHPPASSPGPAATACPGSRRPATRSRPPGITTRPAAAAPPPGHRHAAASPAQRPPAPDEALPAARQQTRQPGCACRGLDLGNRHRPKQGHRSPQLMLGLPRRAISVLPGGLDIDRFTRVAHGGGGNWLHGQRIRQRGRWLSAAVDADPELRMPVLPCSPATLG